MKTEKRHIELLSNLTQGHVYTRGELAGLSKSVDRELKWLEGNQLKKVAPGLYYYPAQSRFGSLPPEDNELIRKFLGTSDFLVLPLSLYNNLELGLTQLPTTVKVYNHKRHATITLADRQYEFKRPNNGFPKKIDKEFLLIDLLNNLDSIGEDPEIIKQRIVRKINNFNSLFLLISVERYGKIAAKKFLRDLLHEQLPAQPKRRKKSFSSHDRIDEGRLPPNQGAAG